MCMFKYSYMYIHVCVYTCVCTYMSIYIYSENDDGNAMVILGDIVIISVLVT